MTECIRLGKEQIPELCACAKGEGWDTSLCQLEKLQETFGENMVALVDQNNQLIGKLYSYHQM